jgi:hypothetical protein
MTNDSKEAPQDGRKRVSIPQLLTPLLVDRYYQVVREVALSALPEADRTDKAATNFMGLIQSSAIQAWVLFEEGTVNVLGGLFTTMSTDRITCRKMLSLYGLHFRGATALEEESLKAAWVHVEEWAKKEGCSVSAFQCNIPYHFELAGQLGFHVTHRVMQKEIV